MARTDTLWIERNGYIEPDNPLGVDVLIKGSSRYVNFNTTVGSSGYGFRDNSGEMQYKDSGGSWISFADINTDTQNLQNVTDQGSTTTNNITIDNGGLSNNDLNINGSTHSIIRSTATDLLQFIHGGSARITVNSSGNLGIGAGNPTGMLTVDSSGQSGNGIELLGTTKDTPVVADNEDTIAIYGNTRAYFKGRDVANDIEFIMGTSIAGEVFMGSMTNHSLSVRTANVERFLVGSNGTVFNEDGLTIDFRVEGTTDENALVVDGSADSVGIGTNSPDYKLDINGEFGFRERSSDPTDPDEGAAVIWMSNGTGSGDDGDIMIKITAGATTKTATLVDFSAV